MEGRFGRLIKVNEATRKSELAFRRILCSPNQQNLTRRVHNDCGDSRGRVAVKMKTAIRTREEVSRLLLDRTRTAARAELEEFIHFYNHPFPPFPRRPKRRRPRSRCRRGPS